MWWYSGGVGIVAWWCSVWWYSGGGGIVVWWCSEWGDGGGGVILGWCRIVAANNRLCVIVVFFFNYCIQD